MKTLHITPAYLPAYRYGGPIQSVHALNKHLVRIQAEVTVYTTAADGPKDLNVPISTAGDLRPVDLDGVQVHYFRPEWPRSWFYSPDMRKALKEHAKEFDVIHITSVFLSVSTLGSRAALAAGVPYLISPRGSLMTAPLKKKSSLKKSLYMSLIERKNLERAGAIHFTTELEKIEYEKLGYRLRRPLVIPNGLDPDSFVFGEPVLLREKFNIPQNKRIILFLGRLSWKKGLDTLIPAFAETAKKIPEAILVLAGGDDEHYHSVVRQLVDDAGVSDKVVFTGQLDGSYKTAAFRSAEAFVLPSYSENFGLAVVEAMYFGVPVIVTEEVALSSMVAGSGSGLVIKKNAKALSEAMLDILQNPKSSRDMGERGVSTAINKFSYDKVAQAFLEAYREIHATGG